MDWRVNAEGLLDSSRGLLTLHFWGCAVSELQGSSIPWCPRLFRVYSSPFWRQGRLSHLGGLCTTPGWQRQVWLRARILGAQESLDSFFSLVQEVRGQWLCGQSQRLQPLQDIPDPRWGGPSKNHSLGANSWVMGEMLEVSFLYIQGSQGVGDFIGPFSSLPWMEGSVHTPWH